MSASLVGSEMCIRDSPPEIPSDYGGPLVQGDPGYETGPFTLAELDQALRGTSNKKKSGPTGMVAEQLKLLDEPTRQDLLNLRLGEGGGGGHLQQGSPPPPSQLPPNQPPRSRL
eukprot:10679476-Alexandrium_andersonii.AAC.1